MAQIRVIWYYETPTKELISAPLRVLVRVRLR